MPMKSTDRAYEPATGDVRPNVPVRSAQAVREPDYVVRNRETWDRWAPQYAGRARAAWQDDALRWGVWDRPESELQIFSATNTAADFIELGCGTGGVCAWLARNGLRPVGVDISLEQLKTAERLQHEFRISFPLVHANAEAVPFDNASFDAVLSEYGASLWCNPRRWLPEAHRLLRDNGRLVFFTNGAFLMACTPQFGGIATDILVRNYFAPYQVEFPGVEAVEFHLTHGHWIRLLRASGFILEDLIEVRPPRNARPRFDFVSLEWARRWPSEEIWIARKLA